MMQKKVNQKAALEEAEAAVKKGVLVLLSKKRHCRFVEYELSSCICVFAWNDVFELEFAEEMFEIFSCSKQKNLCKIRIQWKVSRKMKKTLKTSSFSLRYVFFCLKKTSLI